MFVKHVLHVSKQMFLIQIKNIFACRQANVGSMHACQFLHADLVAGETGKQSDKAPNSDFGQTVLASFIRPLASVMKVFSTSLI